MSEKSPWLTIWMRPRETIRRIVHENPNRSLWFLAAIYGLPSLLNTFQSVSLGNSVGVFPLFLFALVLSPLWGYVVFAVWSWVVCWTGKLFKGVGNFQNVRAAYAWSCVPILVNALLWIFLIFTFGSSLFSSFAQERILSDGEAAVLFLILIAKVILAVWSLVIYINALAEVQQYSVLRAIGNVVLGSLVVGIFFGLVWMLSLRAMDSALGQLGIGLKVLETVWNFGVL